MNFHIFCLRNYFKDSGNSGRKIDKLMSVVMLCKKNNVQRLKKVDVLTSGCG